MQAMLGRISQEKRILMNKQKILAALSADKLEYEFNRIGASIIPNYYFKNIRPPVIYSIQEALTDVFKDAISIANLAAKMDGKPYVNLTTWEFLETDELFIIYDMEQNTGRLPEAKDREHLEAVEHASLTPAGIRRWYMNRKNESEYLISDFEGATIWIPE